MFVSIEAFFWAVLSFVSIYSEVKYITSVDLLEFTDDLEYDWYYFLIFEHPRDTFTDRVRSKLNFRFSNLKKIYQNQFSLLLQ